MLRLMVIAFGLVVFPFNVNGLEQCGKDSDCPGKNIYCLDGYCDGHCFPCQNLNREESVSGCAKTRDTCGPCLLGTEAEDLYGGRKSDYCKTKGEIVNSSPTAVSFENWLKWSLTGASVFIMIAVIIIYIRRNGVHLPAFRSCRNSTSTDSTSNDLNEVVQLAEYTTNPLPFNPNYDGSSESEPLSISVTSGSTDRGHDSSTDTVSCDEFNEGNLCFSFFFRHVGSTSSTSKTPQQGN